MNDIILVETQDGTRQRANVVQKKLQALTGALEDNFFDICDLLLEAHENEYHTIYGFDTFEDWVQLASGIGMSGREARYYVAITKKSKELNLTREQLKAVKISKLKKIMSLDLDEHEQTIRDLINAAPALSLAQVEDEVRKAKGQTPAKFMTVKLEPEVAEIKEQAFELARRNYGSQVVNGEVQEISDSKCFELICVTYLQDPNNGPEEDSSGIGVEEA